MNSIMIVDDEQSIRFTLHKFLEKEGYDVETVGEAESALERIKTACFDVIVTDILLPGINGVELIKEILTVCPCVKVIVITGEPNVSTATEALRLGACDYLFKPVDKNSIIKSVKNALKLKCLEAENKRYQEELEDLVKERTKELEHALDELSRMQNDQIYNERLKVLDFISSGISHDINNSLSPVMIYAEALLERLNGKDSGSINYIQKIIQSAEQIERSIKKLDEFHIKSSDQNSIKGDVEVAGLLKSVGEYFKSDERVINKKLKIIISSDTDGTKISGKDAELTEILKEVVANSIEASENDSAIRISSVIDGSFADIIISDKGCGMTEELSKHCCEPYYTTKGPKFNGLGLSKVYGVVCRNSGRLEIKSEPGTGTDVILTFPVNSEKE